MGNREVVNDPRIVGSILEDHKLVNARICQILVNPSENGFVVHGHYTAPSVRAASLPLEDRGGELVYFRGIRDALESALQGTLKRSNLPDNAPNYLGRFVVD